MPQYSDDEGCTHCDCWGDGGDCCDCGAENDSWDGDEDEETYSAPTNLVCDDDGSEELKD